MKKRKKLETDAPSIGDRLLTLREAADVLRLSTRTIASELHQRICFDTVTWRLRRGFRPA